MPVGDGSDSGDKTDSGSYRIISDRHAIAERRSPKPGRDYPVSLGDLQRLVSSEAEALRYFEKLRFPRGFPCPPCGLRREPERHAGLLVCPVCGHRQSITEGTIFEGLPGEIAPSGLLRMLWDEAEGSSALGPEAVALTLGMVDPVVACALVDRMRAVEGWLTSKPLDADSDIGLARARVSGPLRRGERRMVEVWIALVLARASERVRLRFLAQGQPTELELALDEIVARGTQLFTHLPRVAASLNDRGRPCTLVDFGAAEPPTRPLAQELAGWLAICPEASIDLIDGYLTAFTFRNDTRYDPPGGRFYRLASAAMRFSLDRAEAAGLVG
jgi:hypothetical protein